MISPARIFRLFFKVFVCFVLLSSCHSTKQVGKDYLYFQTERDNIGIIPMKERIIQVNDILNIQVISKTLNQQEAALFNMPAASINENGNTSAGVSNIGYVVGINGDIEFPIIGTLKAAGLTRVQLQDVLVSKLSAYIKEPVVSVRSLQFNVNMLGEVRNPGIKNFQVDKVTVLDAIGAAGDLTEDGKRKDITVIRQENGKNSYIQMDLTSGSVFQSPGYQLQPNDIVYVGATDNKIKSIPKKNNTGTTFRTIGTALSVFIALLNLYFNRIK